MREGSDLNSGGSTSASDHEPQEIPPSDAPAVLFYLNLSHNQLSGSIPPDIGSLRSLETLDLSYNNLEGSIPSSIGGCASLRVLTLSHSGLCGELCSGESKEARAGCWRHLVNLESLRLDGNEFTGAVPAELGELRRLEVLQLQVGKGSTLKPSCSNRYVPSFCIPSPCSSHHLTDAPIPTSRTKYPVARRYHF